MSLSAKYRQIIRRLISQQARRTELFGALLCFELGWRWRCRRDGDVEEMVRETEIAKETETDMVREMRLRYLEGTATKRSIPQCLCHFT
jgi:hypothetical protein